MEYYEYEIVKKIEGLPIKAFFVSIDYREFHWHSDLELIWVLKGSVDLQLSSKTIRLNERDIYLVNTNTIHRLKHSDSRNLLLAFQVSDDIVANYFRHLGQISFDSDYTLNNRDFVDNLEKLMSNIMIEVIEGKAFNLMNAVGCVNILISELFKTIPYEEINKSTMNSHGYDLERLKRVIIFMNRHHSEKITLKQLADTEYISRSRMSHFIKEKLGIGFQDFLNHIRLEHALKLLMKDDENIADISRICGFSDQKYLSKLLRDEYNMTSSEYRSKVKKIEADRLYRQDINDQEFDHVEALELLKSIFDNK
ncbi:MAG: AraC family transcriptional regulator [Spirochaetaceae bacterium]